MSPRDKRQAIWSYILGSESEHGSQFIVTKQDKRIYVVLAAINEIVALPPWGKGGDKFLAYLFGMYGIDSHDPASAAVYGLARHHALLNGLQVDLRRFTAYNTESKTVYFSGYNGRMWRIDGGTPEEIVNGEEGIFFIDDDEGSHVEPDYGPHGILFDMLANLNYDKGAGGINPDQQRRMLITWMFACAFPDMFPHKPLMLVEGAYGSGKTLGVTLIQQALTGRMRPMSVSKHQEKDFGVILLRSPIAMLDNQDTFQEWLQDQICTYATYGDFPKRKLYSDDEEMIIKPQSFVAITSKNPSTFRREDIVDRLLIMRLKRYEQFRNAKKIMAEIAEQRSKIFGEFMWYVNLIVEAMRNEVIPEQQEKWRMSDFATFTRYVGYVLGWTQEEIDDTLDAMQAERDVFAAENDPILEVLHRWITYRVRGQPSNIGREVELTTLFREMKRLTDAEDITFYKHHSTLADKLRTTYVARHFQVEVRHDEQGGRFYRIWRHEDPQLGLVEEEEPIDLAPPAQPIPVIRMVKKGS